MAFFPDDDNVPVPNLLESVTRAFSRHEDAVGLIGRYAPDSTSVDVQRFPEEPARLTRKMAETLVTSNTMYFRAWVVQRLGYFDERFGLGGPFGSAEDMDFALRAMRIGPMYYEPEIFTQHPYKANLFAPYYSRNVAVKVKNKDYVGAARLVGFGTKRMVKGELPAGAIGRGIVLAGRCLFAPRAPRITAFG